MLFSTYLVSRTCDDPPVCPLKTPPCVDSKRPRVCRHHAHMCFNMWAWCRYTRGRFERTHGGFSNVSHHTHRTHTTTRDTTTTTNEDRARDRQRKKTEKEASDVFVLFIPDLTPACDPELVTSFIFHGFCNAIFSVFPETFLSRQRATLFLKNVRTAGREPHQDHRARRLTISGLCSY